MTHIHNPNLQKACHDAQISMQKALDKGYGLHVYSCLLTPSQASARATFITQRCMDNYPHILQPEAIHSEWCQHMEQQQKHVPSRLNMKFWNLPMVEQNAYRVALQAVYALLDRFMCIYRTQHFIETPDVLTITDMHDDHFNNTRAYAFIEAGIPVYNPHKWESDKAIVFHHGTHTIAQLQQALYPTTNYSFICHQQEGTHDMLIDFTQTHIFELAQNERATSKEQEVQLVITRRDDHIIHDDMVNIAHLIASNMGIECQASEYYVRLFVPYTDTLSDTEYADMRQKQLTNAVAQIMTYTDA